MKDKKQIIIIGEPNVGKKAIKHSSNHDIKVVDTSKDINESMQEDIPAMRLINNIMQSAKEYEKNIPFIPSPRKVKRGKHNNKLSHYN